MATRVPQRLLELYGTADAADEAIAFFHRGPGRAVVRLLAQGIEKLVDLRYGNAGRQRMSPTDRTIVLEARLHASQTLESVLSLLTSTRETAEGERDEETE